MMSSMTAAPGAVPLSARARRDVLQTYQDRTEVDGVHLLLPSTQALAPEAYLAHYPSWNREDKTSERRRPARSGGILLGKPTEVAIRPVLPLRTRNVSA